MVPNEPGLTQVNFDVPPTDPAWTPCSQLPPSSGMFVVVAALSTPGMDLIFEQLALEVLVMVGSHMRLLKFQDRDGDVCFPHSRVEANQLAETTHKQQRAHQ